MAVCLDYQTVYCSRQAVVNTVRLQIFAVVLLLCALGLRVWGKMEVTRIGYQLAQERAHTVELDMKRREYELQLSVLRRSDNLAAAATKRLGLKPLDPKQARIVTAQVG